MGSFRKKGPLVGTVAFHRKIADFVICERGNSRIVALVELDDSTHMAAADCKRDALIGAAGYQTIRVQSRHKPTHTEIAALFQHAQAWGQAASEGHLENR